MNQKEDENVKPSELFRTANLKIISEEDREKHTPNGTQVPEIDLDSIPDRNEHQEKSPALYQGTPDQDIYFSGQLKTSKINENKYSKLDIDTLRRFIINRDEELEKNERAFIEIKSFLETLKIEKENLSTQVDTLKAQIEMKDTQIKTLQDTVNMKNEQIEMKEDKIKMKEDQISAYQQSLEEKKNELDRIKDVSVEKRVLEEKEKKIEELQSLINEKGQIIEDLENEARALSQDIGSADEQIADLYNQIDQLKNQSANAVYLSEKQIKEKLKNLLAKSLHNVNLTVPNISDLVELDIFEIKSSVNLKISCKIDNSNPEHQELLEEFSVFDNIQLRIYDEEDRYSIISDGATLFFAARGKDPERLLTFHTEDRSQIKIFNALVLETWLRAKKI